MFEKSRKIHLIVTTTGGSECFNDPFCPDNAFNGVGCSTTVLWNPSQTNVDNWQSDSWVTLAHELYHSKDADNGSWSYARDQSGIYYDEIEACREANRMVLENNPDAVTRTQYAGKMLPSDAIRPVPLKHQE